MGYFDTIGDQPPATDTNANNAWMAARNAAFEQWLSDYITALRGMGFTVTVDRAGGETNIWTQAAYATVTLSKGGFDGTAIVSMTKAISSTPAEAASYDATWAWGYYYSQATAQNPVSQGYLPGPGPTPTVTSVAAAGGSTIQPAQAPSNPDAGTLVSNTASSVSNVAAPQRLTLEQWNYYYQQETGRVGPAPEEIGLTDRNQLMTKSEWAGLVNGWITETYTGTGSGSSSAGSGGSGSSSDGSGSSSGGSGSSSGSGSGAAGSSMDPNMAVALGVVALVSLALLRG